MKHLAVSLTFSLAAVWVGWGRPDFDDSTLAPDDYLEICDMAGCDHWWGLGDEIGTSYGDYFEVVSGSSLKTLRVTGLPYGVSFNPAEWSLTGKPSKMGWYYPVFSAENKNGYKHTLVFRIGTGDVGQDYSKDEIGYDISYYVKSEATDGWEQYYDFDWLYSGGVQQGYPFELKLPTDYKATVKFSTNIKVVKSKSSMDGEPCDKYSCLPLTPGKGTCTVTALIDGEMKTTAFSFIVQGSPSQYFRAESNDPSLGTTSGGGVYAIGTAIPLKATPKSGAVFAGWYYDSSCISVFNPQDGDVDWRTPTVKGLTMGADVPTELYAAFASKEEDLAKGVSIRGFDKVLGEGDEWSLVQEDDGEYAKFHFLVDSLSVPKVTLKSGAPSWISLDPDVSGDEDYEENTCFYKIRVASGKQPTPGLQTVTLQAVNASGARVEKTIYVDVPNLVNEYFSVDDLLEFTPDVAIEPIDFSDVGIDFGAGETLTVSGLPKGLSFDSRLHVVKGTPTAPGISTVTFTAKLKVEDETGKMVAVTAVATATWVVDDYPLLSVMPFTESDEVGGTVTGGGTYKPGTKVTLRATAAKGYVFAGWSGLDEFRTNGLDLRNPTVTYVTGTMDEEILALFVEKERDAASLGITVLKYHQHDRYFDDCYYDDDDDSGFHDWRYDFECYENYEEYIRSWLGRDDECWDEWWNECWEDDVYRGPIATRLFVGVMATQLVAVSSFSLSKIALRGRLPSGLSFNARTSEITGIPTKAGLYTVSIVASNQSGASLSRDLMIRVEELPECACGSFHGLLALGVEDTRSEKILRSYVGPVEVSISSIGRISGKWIVDGKAFSFTSKGFYDRYRFRFPVTLEGRRYEFAINLVDHDGYLPEYQIYVKDMENGHNGILDGGTVCRTSVGLPGLPFLSTSTLRDISVRIGDVDDSPDDVDDRVTLKVARNGKVTVAGVVDKNAFSYATEFIVEEDSLSRGEDDGTLSVNPSGRGFVWVYIPPRSRTGFEGRLFKIPLVYEGPTLRVDREGGNVLELDNYLDFQDWWGN